MRFSQGLTSPERWDLGLLLALLTVTCLCLGVCWNYRSIPALWAQDRQNDPDVSTQGDNPSTPLVRSTYPLTLHLDPLPAPTSTLPQQQITSAIPPTPALAPTVKSKKAITCQWFNGQRYRYWKTVRMHVTAYAPDRRCCWPYDGKTTASGSSVKTNRGKLVAADTRLIPMYALVSVPGYHHGEPVPVLDRGGAIQGHRLDVLLPNYSQAQDWGVKDIEVKVYLPIDN